MSNEGPEAVLTNNMRKTMAEMIWNTHSFQVLGFFSCFSKTVVLELSEVWCALYPPPKYKASGASKHFGKCSWCLRRDWLGCVWTCLYAFICVSSGNISGLSWWRSASVCTHLTTRNASRRSAASVRPERIISNELFYYAIVFFPLFVNYPQPTYKMCQH